MLLRIRQRIFFALAAALYVSVADASSFDSYDPLHQSHGSIAEASPARIEFDELPTGRYLVVADQLGIDLQLTVEHGAEKDKVASITERIGSEYLAFELSMPQSVNVEMAAPDQSSVRGQYRLSVYDFNSLAGADWAALLELTETGRLGTDLSDAARHAEIDRLQRALSALSGKPMQGLAAEIRYRLGINYYWLLQIDEAEQQFFAAEQQFDRTGATTPALTARADRAAAIMEVGRYDEAERLFDEAIAGLNAAGNLHAAAVGTNNRGLLELYRGNTESSVAFFTAAEASFRQQGDMAKAAQAHANLALAYERQGRLRESRQMYSDALGMLSSGTHAWLKSIFLTNLAHVEQQLGNANEALVLLGQAKEWQESIGDVAGLAWTLSGIAAIYRELGDHINASTYQLESVQLRRTRQEAGGLANALLHLGNDYRQRHEQAGYMDGVREALALHEEALLLSSNDAQRAALQLALARDHRVLGNASEAKSHLDRALEVAQRIDRASTLAAVHAEFARAELPGSVTAREHAGIALEHLPVDTPSVQRAEILSLLARSAQTREQSIRLNSEALQVLRTLRRATSNPWLAARMTEFEYPIIEHQLELLFEDFDDQSGQQVALGLVLEHRANALTAMLSEFEQSLGESVSPESSRRLAAAHEAYREGLASLDLARESNDLEREAEARRALRLALGDVDIARATLRSESPAYAQLAYPTVPDLGSVQQWLRNEGNAGTAVLFYFAGENRSYGWVLDRDRVVGWAMPGQDSLSSSVSRMIEGITASSSIKTAELMRRLRNVSRAILPPDDWLTAIDKLIVVPDGPLAVVPFASLPVRLGDRQGFLIEAASIRTVPALSMLIDSTPPKETGKANHAMLVSAGAALTPERAARSIAESLPAAAGLQVEPLLPRPEDVSAQNLSKRFRGYDTLHFATHAWVDVENPALSGLVIGDIAGEPISLTLADIFQLRLDAELVYLSACETALGETIKGESALSLAWGFLYAGAGTVVSTHWQVNERAAHETAQRFYYELLNSGLQPADALRQVQLRMLKGSAGRRHPYYWAAYSAAGAR